MTHYLDNAATTPVRPAALEAMVSQLTDNYGNPSGAHRMARAANHVLDDARDALATALGAQPGQIVFTAGGTEADNLAIRGVVDAVGGVAVTSAVEHHAVLDPVTHLGGRVVAVGPDGRIDLDALAAALDPSVSIVSVMVANNETGVLQPIDDVVSIVRREAPNALLHTDAVQALCWVDVAEVAAEVDLIAVSAHKFGGPKGTGALVVRNGAPLSPLFLGGGQERERRGGTQNVAGIAAMAVAATETVAERAEAVPRVAAMRDRLVEAITSSVGGVVESGVTDVPGVAPGDRGHKTANVAHLCFEGIESEALLFLLEKADVMASAASSCASGAMEPSHVLAAMGVDRSLALGSLRLSLGYGTTDADVDATIEATCAAVERLRSNGGSAPMHHAGRSA